MLSYNECNYGINVNIVFSGIFVLIWYIYKASTYIEHSVIDPILVKQSIVRALSLTWDQDCSFYSYLCNI